MRVYIKTFRCSENFPVHINEQWTVCERDKMVERWRVTKVDKSSFTAVIEEFAAQ